jgi:Zn-dependent M28 family amino/carboxypeptidase
VEVAAFADEQEGEASPFLTITPSLGLLEALFRGEQMNASRVFAATGGGDAMGEPFELNPDKTLAVEIATNVDTIYTQNVVAIQRGADPELADHYVALGAHYDHVGVGTPVNGDAIYNGADDDGSGTVALLSMAEAFAKGPAPQRSIIFVWHAGEEHGLWGARYFNEHLPIPADNVVSQLNIDMIGRSKPEGDTNRANADLTGPNEVYLIGPKVMSDELGQIAESVNDSYQHLDFNYMYDAVDHPTRFFFRSDHVHYARNGIPIIFFFTGTHEDYHRPSDEVDKIDFEKMAKISRTIYAIAWALAHGEGRPAINENLPPELHQQPSP